MKISETKINGVVAEKNGKYWGLKFADGHSTVYGFGSIENARIDDIKYCKTPASMGCGSLEVQELKSATLKKITVVTEYIVEDI